MDNGTKSVYPLKLLGYLGEKTSQRKEKEKLGFPTQLYIRGNLNL